jgi:hypothetical protein
VRAAGRPSSGPRRMQVLTTARPRPSPHRCEPPGGREAGLA